MPKATAIFQWQGQRDHPEAAPGDFPEFFVLHQFDVIAKGDGFWLLVADAQVAVGQAGLEGTGCRVIDEDRKQQDDRRQHDDEVA